MVLLFSLIVLLAVLPVDLYIWAGWLRNMPWAVQLLHFVPVAVLAAAIVRVAVTGEVSEGLVRVVFGLLLCLALPKLLFVLFSVAGRGAGRIWPPLGPSLNCAGAVLALLVAAAAVYGTFCGWKRLTISEKTLVFNDLPENFDGYRAVHISDLHVGTYGRDPRFLRRMVDAVNALDADVILFTGDLVNSDAAELDPFRDVLSRLRARDGVYAVLGNHDYCLYRRYDRADGAAKNLRQLLATERQMGWQPLVNEHRTIRRGADSVVIAGVENYGRGPFPRRADLRRALQGVDRRTFTMLLSHDPSHWRQEILGASSAQLTLSGHTHAMHLRICGYSPSRWLYPEWGGLYSEGGRQLHVSTGVGGTLSFRLGAWPTVDVLTLRRHRP